MKAKPTLKIGLLVVSFLFSITTKAQNIEWQRPMGGSGDDKAYSIEQTSDGGYVVTGVTTSDDDNVLYNHGGRDVWVVKLDTNGYIEWQKTYGGSNWDRANSIQQTSDGGYVVAGYTSSSDGDVSENHGFYDVWVFKIDSSGTLQWEKTFGGSDDDEANSIQQTLDGGYVVAGFTASTDGDVASNHGDKDMWILKLDSSGNLNWEKTLGGSGEDEAMSIIQGPDSNYTVAGYASSSDGDLTVNYGFSDYWVVNLNSSGTIMWQNNYGGSLHDKATSVKPTSDGGYIVAGYTLSNDSDVTGNHGTYDYWVIKIGSTGSLQWEKTLGGSDGDEAYSISNTPDQGYLVVGTANSMNGDVTGHHGDGDFWAVKLNSAGDTLWEKSVGGNLGEEAFSAVVTSQGSYVLAGDEESNDGDISGYPGNHGGFDFWVVKLSTDSASSGIAKPQQANNINVFPNPSDGRVNIEIGNNNSPVILSITDLTGKQVYKSTYNNSKQIRINLPKPSGIYFLDVRTSESNSVLKVVRQ